MTFQDSEYDIWSPMFPTYRRAQIDFDAIIERDKENKFLESVRIFVSSRDDMEGFHKGFPVGKTLIKFSHDKQ
jgi:hypothetical protein